MSNFLGEMTSGLFSALAPLRHSFTNEETFREFFAELGWDVSADPPTLALIRAGFAVDPVFDSARLIADQLQAGTGDPVSLALSLKEAIVQILDAIKQLSGAPPGGLPFPFDQPAFWSEVPGLLLDTLLLSFLQSQQPVLYSVFRLLGLAEVTRENPTGPGRLPYKKFAIYWNRLPLLISNPVDLFRQTYQWDVPGQPFAFAKLIDALEDVFRTIRVPARRRPISAALAARYYAPTNPALSQIEQLAIPIVMIAAPDWSSFAELGLGILPIPPAAQPTQAPVGFVITPLASAGISSAPNPTSPYSLSVKGGFQSDTAFGAEIRPGGVALFADPSSTQITAGLAFTARPEKPWIILGDETSSRLEVGGFAAAIGVTGQIASPEVLVPRSTTRPSSISRIRFPRGTVERGCAITNVVRPANTAAIDAWINCSLSVSRLLVASPKISIWGGRQDRSGDGQPLLLAARYLSPASARHRRSPYESDHPERR